MSNAKWQNAACRLALLFALAAMAVAVVGLVLARYDLIPKIAGFVAFLCGGLLAIVASVAGVAGILGNWRVSTPSRNRDLIALVLSGPFAAFLVTRPIAAQNAPAIHDITTNLADPPVFIRLVLRPDNLVGVGTIENWHKIHASAYGDLRSVTIVKPVATVIADAERLARERGWDIAVSDPKAGHLEATATVSFIRFRDDVVLRAVPTPDKKGSVVDIRSVSRIGVGDLGVNAKRIRSFLKALVGD